MWLLHSCGNFNMLFFFAIVSASMLLFHAMLQGITLFKLGLRADLKGIFIWIQQHQIVLNGQVCVC